MIAVILPSRGLIFSQTAEEILNNLKGVPHKIFFAHRRPLPECFEEPIKKALKDKEITHLWIVEEDMVIPPDTLQKLLAEDANVATCDYPITKDGRGSVFCDKAGNVVFCGTGCLLIKREVLDNMKSPYFSDKVRWSFLNYGEAIKLIASRNKQNEGYGLHDITFSLRLWKQGIKIKVVPAKLGQRKLIEWGKAGSNDGAHKIETWTKVIKNKRLKEIQQQPIAAAARSKLVVVRTPTGDVSTSQGHADTMVRKGKAEWIPKSYVIIDDAGVLW